MGTKEGIRPKQESKLTKREHPTRSHNKSAIDYKKPQVIRKFDELAISLLIESTGERFSHSISRNYFIVKFIRP